MILLPHRSHCGPCVMAIPPHPQITQICTQSEQAELPLVMDIPSAHGACACACARLRQFTALRLPIRETYPCCAGRAHTQSARAGQQLGANMSNIGSMCICWGWALPLVRRTFRFQLVRSRQPLQACFDVEHTRAPTMPGRAGVVAVLSSEKPLPPTRHFVKQSPFLSVRVYTGSLVKPSCLLHRSRVTAADRYRTVPPCFPGPAVTEPRHEGIMHCRLLT
jgi:hypothetical protein